MGYELERAQMEAARNAAEDAYFEARPQIDCNDRRKVFDAGFERAWAARQDEIDRLRNQVELGQQVVNFGVGLMTREQVGRWEGVRHFLEAGTEMYPPFADEAETPSGKVTGSAPADLQEGEEA